MDEEYAEYRCSACKKPVKNQYVSCRARTCTKIFFHSGCANKHRVYDKNNELI
jgi:DNA-directed RNA polymerase subunit RPC12/RpoP